MPEQLVKVSAAALVVAYGQVEMLRLIAEGMPRAEASDAAWRLFGSLLAFVGARTEQPAQPVNAPTRCLAQSSGAIGEALGMAWPDFCRARGFGPSALIDAKVLEQMRWLVDTVRRVADGVNELDAATQARAAIRGRPRKRRKPMTGEDLLATIDEAQSETWHALHAGWLRNAPTDRPLAIESR